jgi:hypothetical protein
MADDNNFLNGVGDVFDTILNNASGIADVINAMNKNGTSSTLATPGAPAAPAPTAPPNATISAHIVQMLADMAKIPGCQSIRFSTVHEGLARWAVKTRDFRISELIMRKAP